MEEKLDRLEKNMNDLIDIVGAIKDNMVTKDELKEEFDKLATKVELQSLEERVNSKLDGLQRSVDAVYERQSAVETRVTKIETELHL